MSLKSSAHHALNARSQRLHMIHRLPLNRAKKKTRRGERRVVKDCETRLLAQILPCDDVELAGRWIERRRVGRQPGIIVEVAVEADVSRRRPGEELADSAAHVFRETAENRQRALVGSTARSVVTSLIVQSAVVGSFSGKAGDDGRVDDDVAGRRVEDDVVGPQAEQVLRGVEVGERTEEIYVVSEVIGNGDHVLTVRHRSRGYGQIAVIEYRSVALSRTSSTRGNAAVRGRARTLRHGRGAVGKIDR